MKFYITIVGTSYIFSLALKNKSIKMPFGGSGMRGQISKAVSKGVGRAREAEQGTGQHIQCCAGTAPLHCFDEIKKQ